MAMPASTQAIDVMSLTLMVLVNLVNNNNTNRCSLMRFTTSCKLQNKKNTIDVTVNTNTSVRKKFTTRLIQNSSKT